MATTKPVIVKLMIDGELHDAMVRVDGNGEWACYTKIGRTFFFPQTGVDENGETVEFKLADHVKKHNAVNAVKPVLAEDAEPLVDAELEAWLSDGEGETDPVPADTEDGE